MLQSSVASPSYLNLLENSNNLQISNKLESTQNLLTK